jgi:hypothetical protein
MNQKETTMMTVTQALKSGSEQMSMEQFLAYNRNYSARLLAQYRALKAEGTDLAAIEDTRIELASLGIRP